MNKLTCPGAVFKANTLQTVEIIDHNPPPPPSHPIPPTIMKKDMRQLRIFTSVLLGSITYHHCVIQSEEIIGCDFASLTILQDSREKKTAVKIVSDPSQSTHTLPTGVRYQTMVPKKSPDVEAVSSTALDKFH